MTNSAKTKFQVAMRNEIERILNTTEGYRGLTFVDGADWASAYEKKRAEKLVEAFRNLSMCQSCEDANLAIDKALAAYESEEA